MNVEGYYWFYTLSAIPQALAAMIAVVATFAVYRLSYINQLITPDLKFAHWFLLKIDPGKYYQSFTNEKIPEIFEEEAAKLEKNKERLGLTVNQFTGIQDELSEIIKTYYGLLGGYYTSNSERMREFIQQKAKGYKENNDSKKQLYNILKTSIKITAFPIIFSLIFLPFYSIIPWLFLRITIVFIAVVSALCSIKYTAKGVWKISHL